MASLDALPPAVFRLICDTIAAQSPRSALPAYATVSWTWQRAFERHTFHSVYLSSARLDQLGDVITRERQGYVLVMTLHVALAPYHRTQRDDLETAEDGDRATRVLTSTIQDFFGTLSRWRPADGPPEGIHLELLVESPSDDAGGGSHYQSYSKRSRSPSTTRRARSAVVRIDIPGHALPQTPLVSALTCSGRHMELSSVLFLLSRLPRLRLLDTEVEHDTTEDRDMEQRREFVLGLSHYAPNVTDLRLRRPMNSCGGSQKAPSKEARSLFHTLLLKYSQRCAYLTFDDCVDARLLLSPFRDEPSSSNNNSNNNNVNGGEGPSIRHSTSGFWWPHLRRLHIRNSYMMRRPYTRVHSRASALRSVHEVVLLAGRAVRYMPSATNVRVRQYVLTGVGLEQITVQYEAGETTARIYFDGVEPVPSTIEAWRASVWAVRGVELEVNVR